MLYTNALLEVRARLQELVPDFWLDNECYRAINEGVQRFCQEEKWPFLYSVKTGVALTAGTATQALEAGVSYERHFNLMVTFAGDLRGRQPARVHPSEGYRLRQVYYNNQSEPIAYYIISEANAAGVFTATVRLVPALTRACVIEYQYIRDPVTVTVPTTEQLDIPEEYAMGVVAYATGQLFLKELNFSQKAEEQFALYQKSVQDAKREARKIVPGDGLVWGKTQPQFGDYGLDSVWAWDVPLLGP